MRLIWFVFLASFLFGGAAFAAAPVVYPKPDARRLEVLFLGSPSASSVGALSVPVHPYMNTARAPTQPSRAAGAMRPINPFNVWNRSIKTSVRWRES